MPFDDGMADIDLAVGEVVTDVKLHPLGVVLVEFLNGSHLLDSRHIENVDKCG